MKNVSRETFLKGVGGMKKLNWQIGISVFILVFTGSMLRALINISASLIFWGIAACILALYSVKNPCWDLKEEYKSLDIAKKRNKITVITIFLIGISCLVAAAILYFDHSTHWAVMLVLVVVILLIPGLCYDKKLWREVPREERPLAYRGLKSEENDVEEQ